MTKQRFAYVDDNGRCTLIDEEEIYRLIDRIVDEAVEETVDEVFERLGLNKKEPPCGAV